MQPQFLDFEKPIVDLQSKIKALQSTELGANFDIAAEIERLEQKQAALTQSIFSQLNSWQVVQLARHPERPRLPFYLSQLFTEFDCLAGDRHFKDDKAILGGMGRLNGRPVMVIGHQKGTTTQEKVFHNFGMPKPEGYRKALRLIRLAEQFHLPIISFIDTPGAYPGMDAEARNQSEAIAVNLQVLSEVKTPIISVVLGEGGSGGALAIGVSDMTCMLQYSIYSVISPEGCASILWRDVAKASAAAQAMGITADRLLELGLIDEVIPEPLGGAHRDPSGVADTIKTCLMNCLNTLISQPIEHIVAKRYQQLLEVGRV